MKAYITKYALSKGIFELEGEKRGIAIAAPHYDGWYYPPDWYETREEAIARAEQMRQKKIASLEKQIEKLKNMKFE